MSRDLDTLIGRISPISDTEAARLIGPDADREILRQITASSAQVRTARRRAPRGLTLGLPLVVGAAAAAVAVATIVQPDNPDRPAPTPTTGPSIKLAAALAFKQKGDYIEVRIRDPLADPERYRAEFAAHGMKVSLKFVSASPTIVGTLVMLDSGAGPDKREIKIVEARGKCETGGAGDRCPVAVRIPVRYRNSAEIVFGRAARPGEQYNSSAPVTAPGEAMHNLVFKNHRVQDVLAKLSKRHVTVPEYRYLKDNYSHVLRPGQVPGNWYVHGAGSWAKKQVLLFVGPTPGQS